MQPIYMCVRNSTAKILSVRCAVSDENEFEMHTKTAVYHGTPKSYNIFHTKGTSSSDHNKPDKYTMMDLSEIFCGQNVGQKKYQKKLLDEKILSRTLLSTNIRYVCQETSEITSSDVYLK